MSNPIITLTTDYGTSDHLVGVLKGVILRIVPNATIVDINHHVAPFDLLDGALTIGAAYRYFPPRTVHLVVVDPGVGTERRPILVSADQQYFVAPDNGVLSLIYEREATVSVRHITAEHYFLNPVSNTFHGRDVFAPVAAWLAKTFQTEAMGEEITDYVRFALPRAEGGGYGAEGRGAARGRVWQSGDELHGRGFAGRRCRTDGKISAAGGRQARWRNWRRPLRKGAAGEPVADYGIQRVPGNRGE